MSEDTCISEGELRCRFKVTNISELKRRSLSYQAPPFTFRHLEWRVELKFGILGRMEIWLNVAPASTRNLSEWSCQAHFLARILAPSTDNKLKKMVWKRAQSPCSVDQENTRWLIPFGMELPLYSDLISKKYVAGDDLWFELRARASYPDGFRCQLANKEIKLIGTLYRGMVEDYGGLLTSEEDSDVTLISSEGDSMKAHKLVLKTRSKVFKTMFNSSLSEASSGEVKLNDMGSFALEMFLKYIYTGEPADDYCLNTPTEVFKQLVNAGEKYELPGLKEWAGLNILKTLSVSNAWDLLIFIKKYNLPEVESGIMKFIKADNHIDKIMQKAS